MTTSRRGSKTGFTAAISADYNYHVYIIYTSLANGYTVNVLGKANIANVLSALHCHS